MSGLRAPPPDSLRSVLTYDPASGRFNWLVSMRGPVKAGDVAGASGKNGYVKIKYQGINYQAHHLAWWFVTGSMPADEIDHINRVTSDNRLGNLRPATRLQNCQNTGGWANKKSGLPRGVTLCRRSGKYMARVSINGRSRNLGRFDTPALADEFASAVREMVHGPYGV